MRERLAEAKLWILFLKIETHLHPGIFNFLTFTCLCLAQSELNVCSNKKTEYSLTCIYRYFQYIVSNVQQERVVGLSIETMQKSPLMF